MAGAERQPVLQREPRQPPLSRRQRQPRRGAPQHHVAAVQRNRRDVALQRLGRPLGRLQQPPQVLEGQKLELRMGGTVPHVRANGRFRYCRYRTDRAAKTRLEWRVARCWISKTLG